METRDSKMARSAFVTVETLEWAGRLWILCHSEQQSDEMGAARVAQGCTRDKCRCFGGMRCLYLHNCPTREFVRNATISAARYTAGSWNAENLGSNLIIQPPS